MAMSTVGAVSPTTDLSTEKETSIMPLTAHIIPTIFEQRQVSSRLPKVACQHVTPRKFPRDASWKPCSAHSTFHFPVPDVFVRLRYVDWLLPPMFRTSAFTVMFIRCIRSCRRINAVIVRTSFFIDCIYRRRVTVLLNLRAF